jgi:hypothetical protein
VRREKDNRWSANFGENLAARGRTVNRRTQEHLSLCFLRDLRGKRREVRYEVVVGELDALAKVIFEESKFNPLFFTKSLNRHALTYLKELNQSNIW